MRVSYQLRAAAAGLPTLQPPRRRVIYFDIDGTLVRPTFGRVKKALGDGRFERILRRAGFDRVVCVSYAVTIARLFAEVGDVSPREETREILFRFCAGAFEDRDWFDANVELVRNPMGRVTEFDFGADWYYVDDRASWYLDRAGLPAANVRERVLQCDPRTEGEDVALWLADLAPGRVQAGERHDDVEAPRRYGLGASLAPYSWRRE